MGFKLLKRATLSKAEAFIQFEYILLNRGYKEREFITLCCRFPPQWSWIQSVKKEVFFFFKSVSHSTRCCCEVKQPCFPSRRSLSNSLHISASVLPCMNVRSANQSWFQHLYIHLCANTRLNVVIVLNIESHMYTFSSVLHLIYTNHVL